MTSQSSAREACRGPAGGKPGSRRMHHDPGREGEAGLRSRGWHLLGREARPARGRRPDRRPELGRLPCLGVVQDAFRGGPSAGPRARPGEPGSSSTRSTWPSDSIVRPARSTTPTRARNTRPYPSASDAGGLACARPWVPSAMRTTMRCAPLGAALEPVARRHLDLELLRAPQLVPAHAPREPAPQIVGLHRHADPAHRVRHRCARPCSAST